MLTNERLLFYAIYYMGTLIRYSSGSNTSNPDQKEFTVLFNTTTVDSTSAAMYFNATEALAISDNPTDQFTKHLEHFDSMFAEKNAWEPIPSDVYVAICKYMLLEHAAAFGNRSQLETFSSLAESYAFRRYVNETLFGDDDGGWTYADLPDIVNSTWNALAGKSSSDIVDDIANIQRVFLSDMVNARLSEKSIRVILSEMADKYGLRSQLTLTLMNRLSKAILIDVKSKDDTKRILEDVMVALRNAMYPACLNCNGR